MFEILFFFRNPQSCVNFNIFSNFVCWFDKIFNIRYHVHQVLLPVYVYFANCPFLFVSILKKLEQLQRKLLPLKFPKRLFDADLFIVNHDSLYCGRSLTFSFKWLKAWDIFHILFIPITFFQNISTSISFLLLITYKVPVRTSRGTWLALARSSVLSYRNFDQ